VNALAQGALRWFTPRPRIISHNLPIERRTLNHWAIAAPTKSSSPMPRCQVMLWCQVMLGRC